MYSYFFRVRLIKATKSYNLFLVYLVSSLCGYGICTAFDIFQNITKPLEIRPTPSTQKVEFKQISPSLRRPTVEVKYTLQRGTQGVETTRSRVYIVDRLVWLQTAGERLRPSGSVNSAVSLSASERGTASLCFTRTWCKTNRNDCRRVVFESVDINHGIFRWL